MFIVNDRELFKGVSFEMKYLRLSSATKVSMAAPYKSQGDLFGNKLFKLIFHFQRMRKRKAVLSFGGMHSNHLHALAHLGEGLDVRTIGLVRAYKDQPSSDTYRDLEKRGMELHRLDPKDYLKRHDISYLQAVQSRFPSAYIIPEGGYAKEGIDGARLMAQCLQRSLQSPVDYVIMPVGTGTTFAGFLVEASQNSFFSDTTFLGIAAVKDENTIINRCKQALSDSILPVNWSLIMDYTLGGFAKVSPDYAKFFLEFERCHNILLDPVYTGKMMYAVNDLLRQGCFKDNSSVVCVHTGGLQGRRGLMGKLERLAQS